MHTKDRGKRLDQEDLDGKNTSTAGNPAQPTIVAKKAAILRHDGLLFKDLNGNGKLHPYEDWRRPVEERVDDLLRRMTLEEKAGLMVRPALGMAEGGALLEEPQTLEVSPGVRMAMGPATTEAIVRKQIRHVLTRSHDRPEVLAAWNNRLQELAEGSRLGIPVTISSDPRNGFQHDPNATSVRAGFFSQWPEPIGLAATRDEELVRQFGQIAGREYRATGIRTALHPMADLATEPRWGRIVGTFGEDAGVDQFGGDHTPEIIVDLVRKGELGEARIDASVRRLLRTKFELGLFENSYVDPEQAKAIVGNPEFQAVADLAQRKSIVLLKNQAAGRGKTLPLSQGTKIYVEGIDPAIAAEYGTVVDRLEAADVALLRVQTPFETGPGFFGRIHQGNLAFRGEALQRLQDIMRAKPTVIDIYLDRPAVIPELEQEAAALLGSFGASDRALLDVLFGRFAPAGKLPFELPSSMEAVERQKEDVPYDSENPLYEFGFGLSYQDG